VKSTQSLSRSLQDGRRNISRASRNSSVLRSRQSSSPPSSATLTPSSLWMRRWSVSTSLRQKKKYRSHQFSLASQDQGPCQPDQTMLLALLYSHTVPRGPKFNTAYIIKILCIFIKHLKKKRPILMGQVLPAGYCVCSHRRHHPGLPDCQQCPGPLPPALFA
jgi:hypothetical protein